MTANEPLNDSSADGIDALVGAPREGPKFSRVLIVVAATTALVTRLPGLALHFAAVAVMFDTFLETRWPARFVGMGSPDTSAGLSR